jgi:hypothetical protein
MIANIGCPNVTSKNSGAKKIPFLRTGKGKYSHEKQKCYLESKILFFLFVTPFELVDSTSSIYEYILSGEERVRCRRDLKLDQRIFIAIFPFQGLFAWSGRAAQKGYAIRHILENNKPVIAGVEVLFHISLDLKGCTDFAVQFEFAKPQN